jgi:hypothetical protein
MELLHTGHDDGAVISGDSVPDKMVLIANTLAGGLCNPGLVLLTGSAPGF